MFFPACCLVEATTVRSAVGAAVFSLEAVLVFSSGGCRAVAVVDRRSGILRLFELTGQWADPGLTNHNAPRRSFDSSLSRTRLAARSAAVAKIELTWTGPSTVEPQRRTTSPEWIV